MKNLNKGDYLKLLQDRDRVTAYLLNRFIDVQALFAAYKFPLTKHHKKLSLLQNKHQGETGFLIGNGPSVKIEDLERLKNKTTFCCNRFYLAYDKMEFRPQYTISADRQMIEDFGNEIVNKSQGVTILCSEKKPKINADFIWLRLRDKEPWVNSNKIYSYVYQSGATLLAALQIGYFMGIKKFVLYGVDHNFSFKINEASDDQAKSAIGENNHFIRNYRSGKAWAPPETELIEKSFVYYDRFLRAQNGWIKNATRGSKLEVLEMVDFNQIIDK